MLLLISELSVGVTHNQNGFRGFTLYGAICFDMLPILRDSVLTKLSEDGVVMRLLLHPSDFVIRLINVRFTFNPQHLQVLTMKSDKVILCR